jgi:hypothetical protein
MVARAIVAVTAEGDGDHHRDDEEAADEGERGDGPGRG